MNVEQILTDELRSVAASVEAPLPPIAGLVRDAEHARTRTLRTRLAGTVLVAAAVVGAIVIGTQVGRPSTAPLPTNPSPSYYAPGVPYVLDGVLYVDHEPQPGSWAQAETVGEYTVALRHTDSLPTAVVMRDGEELFTVPNLITSPVISRNGKLVATIELPGAEPGGPRFLVLRDLAGGSSLGRLELPPPVGRDAAEASLATVDADGTVHYGFDDDAWWSWKPGGNPTPAEEPSGETVVNPPGFAGVDAWVLLSPDHLWGAWLTDGLGNPLSPDLSPEGVTLQKPGAPESRFTIPFTDTTELEPFLSWESPTELVVIGVPSDVRCDIVTRRCRD